MLVSEIFHVKTDRQTELTVFLIPGDSSLFLC